MEWMDGAPEGVLAMRRFTAEPGHPSLAIVINMTEATTHLPSSWGTDIVLASEGDIATLSDDASSHLVMGPETAVWLRR